MKTPTIYTAYSLPEVEDQHSSTVVRMALRRDIPIAHPMDVSLPADRRPFRIVFKHVSSSNSWHRSRLGPVPPNETTTSFRHSMTTQEAIQYLLDGQLPGPEAT